MTPEQMTPPEDWRLIQGEPTEAMSEAYCHALHNLGFTAWVNASTIWPVLLSASPPPPVQGREEGWQPIETAPRDGTDFLVACQYQRRRHQMVGGFMKDGKFRSWPGRHVYEPIAWQPLPNPPQQSTGPEGAE